MANRKEWMRASVQGDNVQETRIQAQRPKGKSFAEQVLREANFDYALLKGANFTSADLFGSQFYEAEATEAKGPKYKS